MILLLVRPYFADNYNVNERGKAGGHEPPLFPLPCHIFAFFSSGSHEPPLFPLPYHRAFDSSGQNYFFKWYIWPLKCDFKKSSRVTQKSTTQAIFSTVLIKINILCVLKLFYNEVFDKFDWVLHLEISQSWLMSDFKMV